MKQEAVVVYGAGISGRGAVQVLAKRGQEVYLYNDTPCQLDDETTEAMVSVGGNLVIGAEKLPMLFAATKMMVLSPVFPAITPMF